MTGKPDCFSLQPLTDPRACKDCTFWLDCRRESPNLRAPRAEGPELIPFVLEPAESPRDTQVGGDHYTRMKVQPWDVVDTWPIEQRIGYYRGGALKYIMRLGAKDASVQESNKAAHYCRKLAETLEAAS